MIRCPAGAELGSALFRHQSCRVLMATAAAGALQHQGSTGCPQLRVFRPSLPRRKRLQALQQRRVRVRAAATVVVCSCPFQPVSCSHRPAAEPIWDGGTACCDNGCYRSWQLLRHQQRAPVPCRSRQRRHLRHQRTKAATNCVTPTAAAAAAAAAGCHCPELKRQAAQQHARRQHRQGAKGGDIGKAPRRVGARAQDCSWVSTLATC
jgi:hypothetical protein